MATPRRGNDPVAAAKRRRERDAERRQEERLKDAHREEAEAQRDLRKARDSGLPAAKIAAAQKRADAAAKRATSVQADKGAVKKPTPSRKASTKPAAAPIAVPPTGPTSAPAGTPAPGAIWGTPWMDQAGDLAGAAGNWLGGYIPSIPTADDVRGAAQDALIGGVKAGGLNWLDSIGQLPGQIADAANTAAAAVQNWGGGATSPDAPDLLGPGTQPQGQPHLPVPSIRPKNYGYGYNPLAPLQNFALNHGLGMMMGTARTVPIMEPDGKGGMRYSGKTEELGGMIGERTNRNTMNAIDDYWDKAIAAGNQRRALDLQEKKLKIFSDMAKSWTASQPTLASAGGGGGRRGSGRKPLRKTRVNKMPQRNVNDLDKMIAQKPLTMPGQMGQMAAAQGHRNAQAFSNQFAPALASWNNSATEGMLGSGNRAARSDAAWKAQNDAYNRAATQMNNQMRLQFMGAMA